MTYSVVDFVAEQLEAAAPRAEWGAAGVDRAAELAAILARNGIVDLGKLKLVKTWTDARLYPWYPAQIVESLALQYEGKHFGFLGGPHEPENRSSLHLTDKGYEVAWSAEGKGHVGFVLEPAAAGFAIVPVWGSSSDADKIRRAIITIATIAVSFVLPLAGISTGLAIGSAVVPASFAAAYPGITATIGNVALSAAMTGGDIETAVVGAVTNYFSGFVGAQAAGITDIQGIGKVASAITRAYIQGGDVETALKQSLISQGASIVADLYSLNWTTPATSEPDLFADPWAPVDWTQPVDPWSPDPWAYPDPVDFLSDPLPGDSVDLFNDPWAADPFAFDVNNFDVTDINWNFNPSAPASPIPTVTDTSSSDDWSLQNVLVNFNALQQAALSLYANVLKVQSMSTVNQAQVSNAGTTTRTLDDGRIATRHPDGRVTYSLPPPNTAMATMSGNMIVNRGDGTYALIDSQGRQTVHSYSGGNSGSPNLGALLAMGVGAFLLMK